MTDAQLAMLLRLLVFQLDRAIEQVKESCPELAEYPNRAGVPAVVWPKLQPVVDARNRVAAQINILAGPDVPVATTS